MFVSNKKCSEDSDFLKSLNIKPVRGTMAVQTVVSLGNSCIAMRDSSCFTNGKFYTGCSGWYRHAFIEPTHVNVLDNTGTNSTNVDANTEAAQSISCVTCMNDVLITSDDITGHPYQTDSQVAVVHDAQWHIGSILEYGPEDSTYLISFITKGNNRRGVTLK